MSMFKYVIQISVKSKGQKINKYNRQIKELQITLKQ